MSRSHTTVHIYSLVCKCGLKKGGQEYHLLNVLGFVEMDVVPWLQISLSHFLNSFFNIYEHGFFWVLGIKNK